MMVDRAARLRDEAGRIAAIKRYGVLDHQPERAFEEITELVKAIFDTPIVAVTLIDVDRQWFLSRLGIEPAQTSREVAFCHYTIQSDVPMIVRDAICDPRFAGNPLVTGAPLIRSYLGAPLCTPEGYNVGSICVIDDKPRDFTDADAALLRKFADLVIAQLELRQIACRDGLTGAYTRRAFEDEIERELARHKRYGAPVALAVFDLDHFKRINDSYGHPTGDEVLRATVAACQSAIRSSDCLGRIGGEEFGLLLFGAGFGQAASTLERLRAAVERATLPDHPEIDFTASFGAAPCAAEYRTAGDWMAAADACLYAAKRAGRNRCVVAPTEGS